MNSILTENKYLSQFLPTDLEIVDAEGDRFITKHGDIYFNYFNDSLRWLCGYDNSELNKIINKDIEVIQQDPSQIRELYLQMRDILRLNVSKKYKDTLFLPRNTFFSLKDNLIQNDEQFFINLTTNYNIPDELKDDVLELSELLDAEIEPKRDKLTNEGWSTKKIKQIFSQYKNRIAGLIMSPLLIEKGIFLSRDTCIQFAKLCGKYNIPIIWDESLTCFFRSSSFYMLNQYPIEPEFVTINSMVNQNKDTFILILKKGVRRRMFKKYQELKPEQNAAPLIILHSILMYISENNIPIRIERVTYRLTRKLNALSVNLHKRFRISNRGIIVYIRVSQDLMLKRLTNFLLEQRIVVLSNDKNAILLDPQLTLSNRSVDTFIQAIDDFFKSGIKLQSHKTR